MDGRIPAIDADVAARAAPAISLLAPAQYDGSSMNVAVEIHGHAKMNGLAVWMLSAIPKIMNSVDQDIGIF